MSAFSAPSDFPPPLERVASAHSARTAGSSKHALSSVAATELHTPPRPDDGDLRVRGEDEASDAEEVMVMEEASGHHGAGAEARSARARLGQIGTQSMQDLKKSRALSREREGRERSMTDSRPSVPKIAMPKPAPQHAQPVLADQRAAAARPPKSSGGFSGFLRRLTGKGKKDKKSTAAASAPVPAPIRSAASGSTPLPTLQEARQSVQDSRVAAAARPAPLRQETAPVVSAKPARQPTVRQNSMPSSSAPSASQAKATTSPLITRPAAVSDSARASSSPISQIVPLLPEAPVDPASVPLPPSPVNSPAISEVETLRDFGPLPTVPSASGSGSTSSRSTTRRAKQSPMLSFEGFEFQEDPDETDEEADQVRPLRPLRIDTTRDLSPGMATSLKSASSIETTETVETVLRTPNTVATGASTTSNSYFDTQGNGDLNLGANASASENESSPERNVMRLAGSSPPRKAPIGTGMGGLDRKGSKWRKSVMGISDSLNSTVTRKQTTRQPPSSHDAYMIQQRRIANNRVSCQPTLHSNASIAANLTTIKDKKEQDVAETFFLS